jgi:predicted GIY-YIG superfamily endonuclease
MDKAKHFYLYVLRLNNQKWYVGITTQHPEQRLKRHLNGWGSYWTKEYPPIEFHDVQDLGFVQEKHALLYESHITRIYMNKYGLNNVRGGDLTELVNYHQAFGRIFAQPQWEAIIAVLVLTLVCLLTIVAYILKK